MRARATSRMNSSGLAQLRGLPGAVELFVVRVGDAVPARAGLKHRANRSRHDAVRARVFRVHWRIDKGQPRRITLRRVVPIIVTVADGGDRAPEVIGIFGIEDSP